MTEEEMKEWIDNASYEELLFKWRFAPVGHPLFRGATGDYFKSTLDKKKEELTHEERVGISKKIGF